MILTMDIKRLTRSFRFAFRGLGIAFRGEQNLRIFFAIAAINIILALVLKLNLIEWAIGIVTTLVVISIEIVNTALEELLDMISPEYNGRTKVIKDMLASAALGASICALIIALIIYLPHIV